MQPHRPIAAGAQLPAFEVEEFIRRDILRQDESAVFLQEDREDDAVENDVVLPDKMQEARVVGLPPFLPFGVVILRPLLGGADVADGRIKPDVQRFAFRTGQRHWHAPIEVARHGAGTQSFLQPAVALAEHLWLPLSGVMLLERL